MTQPAIQVENLIKTYPNGNRAVDGIGFEVHPGEVFGLLGPNGAGKTTTVEILEGLRTADPDSRTVHVLGLDVRRDAETVKQRIGVALQTATLMPNLTAWEILDLWGSFFPKSVSPDALLERMDLTEKRGERVQSLSGGQQQRLSVALALVGDPEIVFLDEPTTGLDPQARRALWQVVQDLKSSGKTVVLTTHYMEEAERLCDRLAIMDHGKILALDTPTGLVKSQFSEQKIGFSAPDPETTAADFAALPGVARAASEDGDIALYSSDVPRTLAALLERSERLAHPLGEIRLGRATLEDVFLKMTGRRIRE